MNDRERVLKNTDQTPFDAALLRAMQTANGFGYGLITSVAITDTIKHENEVRKMLQGLGTQGLALENEIERMWQKLAEYPIGNA